MSSSDFPLNDHCRKSVYPALTQPSQFMPTLVEAIQDELAFYSHDINGKTTYLSKSSVQVLNHSSDRRLEHPFWDFLTDDPCNDSIRSQKATTESTSVMGRICEIFDSEGNRLKLKYWQVPIVHDGMIIGQSGIIRRLNDDSNDGESLGTKEQEELMAKVGMLTEVELNVIDMVVDGRMNKEMAAILNVAVRTIESRRSRAMAKLKTKTISELVQVWVQFRRIRAATKRGLPPESDPIHPSLMNHPSPRNHSNAMNHSTAMNSGTLCGPC